MSGAWCAVLRRVRLRGKLTVWNVLIGPEGRRWIGLTPREEEHLAGLNLVRAAKQRSKGSCDCGDETAVLREGLGGHQDQSRVSLSGSAVAAVKRHEVFDVGGDKRPPLTRRISEDLIVREPHQGWLGNDRDDVMTLGTELLSDGVGEHFVQQQRMAHDYPAIS
jgi:hypothetical protein